MITVSILVLTLALALVIWLFVYGYMSRTGSAPGLSDGKLTACPNKKNCVCSEYPNQTLHYVEPIPLVAGLNLEKIADFIKVLNGTVVQRQDNYLAATFTSSLFGFVDDLEIRLDVENRLIHIRSASRVGSSDLGVNKNRVEKLESLLATKN